MAKLSVRETKLASAVKRANQRLRELEKHGKVKKESSAYESIREKAKKGAEYLGKTNKGQLKFRTDISKMTSNQKRKLEEEVQKFLSAKTSTVKGIKKSRKKGFETVKKQKEDSDELIEKYKNEVIEELHITEEEYYDIWGSKAVENASKILSSSQIQQIILATPENTTKKEVIDAFKQAYWKNHDFIETIKEDFGYTLDKDSNVKPKKENEKEKEKEKKRKLKNSKLNKFRK